MITPKLYSHGMESAALDRGDHLYLVAVGPRVTVRSLTRRDGRWSIRTECTVNGIPHTVIFNLRGDTFPQGEVSVQSGVIVVKTGEHLARFTAVEVARHVLATEAKRDAFSGIPDGLRGYPDWFFRVLSTFFRYEIVYVGQAYGRNGRRSAVKRLASGHEHLQKVLSDIVAYRPETDVGIIMLNIDVTERMIHWKRGQDVESMTKIGGDFLADFNGPFADDRLLLDAAEAILIRFFAPSENLLLKDFPKKDAPKIVKLLRDAGLTHLGIDIDLTDSFALICDEVTGCWRTAQRFAVNIETGEREAPDLYPGIPFFAEYHD